MADSIGNPQVFRLVFVGHQFWDKPFFDDQHFGNVDLKFGPIARQKLDFDVDIAVSAGQRDIEAVFHPDFNHSVAGSVSVSALVLLLGAGGVSTIRSKSVENVCDRLLNLIGGIYKNRSA